MSLEKLKILYDNQGKKYYMQSHIGSGGFAEVYLVKSAESKKTFACKFIEKARVKSKKQADKIKSEIRLHSLCGGGRIHDKNKNNNTNTKNKNNESNDYVVPFHGCWETRKYICILMDYCPNGSLQDWLDEREIITEQEVRFVIKQITMAIKYLHDKYNIIHRDLKLGNILFDDKMNIKICDFGLATRIENGGENRFTVCGTPNYIAPEIAKCIGGQNKMENNGHSYEVDIWAIGIMAFSLIYGYPPFQTENIKKTCERIKKSQFIFPNKIGVSRNIKDLIKNILIVDVEYRLTLRQILKHPFIKDMRIPECLPKSCLMRKPTMRELYPFDDKENDNNKEVKIIKFVDHYDKYGIAYVLSNGITGILFQDNTSFLVTYNNRNICFVSGSGDFMVHDYKYFVDEGNFSCRQKFKIFKSVCGKIWKSFQGKKNNNLILENINVDSNTNTNINNNYKNIIYLEKYEKTKHCKIFTLTNQAQFKIYNHQMTQKNTK